MEKVYVLSEHSDEEVERAIAEMPEYKLRVALYGIARGWGFDRAMNVALFIGMQEQEKWISNMDKK